MQRLSDPWCHDTMRILGMGYRNMTNPTRDAGTRKIMWQAWQCCPKWTKRRHPHYKNCDDADESGKQTKKKNNRIVFK
eukprot:scaffold179597_cov62-Attheya_sp.AAC.3